MSSPSIVLFFTLTFIYTTFIHAAIAKQNIFKKDIELRMITVVYYKNFPYKKAYDKDLIPDCKKIYTNKSILRCKEYIQLMRPATLIKTWQRTQKEIGYLPITLPEFNIFNEAGKIVSIIPAATYSKHFLSKTNSTGHMVTGKFIRHSDKVGHYMFTTGKDSAIDNVNATDNHLFYVKNKNKFIPVSKIQPTDSLINKEGKTVHLKHVTNCKNKDEKLTGKPLETVYNLEISSNHTYFVGSHNILAHNTCITLMYYNYLVKENLICVPEDNSNVYLKYAKEDKIRLCSFSRDNGRYIEQYKASEKMPIAIERRLRRMGFISGYASGKSDKMILALPMTRLEYENILPDVVYQQGKSDSSLCILGKAQIAYSEKRFSLYKSIFEIIQKFQAAGLLKLLSERSTLLTQEDFVGYFDHLNNEELQNFLDEKNNLWQAIRKPIDLTSLLLSQCHK